MALAILETFAYIVASKPPNKRLCLVNCSEIGIAFDFEYLGRLWEVDMSWH